ncbi:MAG: GDSL-type esterase/lipase family protein [Cytophagales bacterium]|nr:GDSL-type esterase/lipase family protein [Cytophagales bacterium]
MRVALLLLVVCWCTGCFAQATYDSMPNQPAHYRQRTALFQAEQASDGGILFLGNSIVESGNWKKLLMDSSVINRGIFGDNTFGVLARLDEIIRHKPRKLFLLIGINDLSKDVPKAVVLENIFSIVSQVKGRLPKTEVFVHSLLPVNPSVKGFPASFSKQAAIEEVNGQLKKYDTVFKYTYVNLYNDLLDGHNKLDAELTVDGLHLNASGYDRWVSYLKKNKCL